MEFIFSPISSFTLPTLFVTVLKSFFDYCTKSYKSATKKALVDLVNKCNFDFCYVSEEPNVD